MKITINDILFLALLISTLLGTVIGATSLLGLPSVEDQRENAYYFLNLMKITLHSMLALFIVISVVLIIIVNQ